MVSVILAPDGCVHIRRTTGASRTRLTFVRSGGLARASVVVGREIELEALRRAVRDAQRGATRCIFLVGEGGIGKTRLLTEASAHVRHVDAAVLSGRASIATPVAFSVVADGLRSWLRGHPAPPPLGPFDRGLAVVLPEWQVPTGGAELDTAQLWLLALEGVVRLLREIASTGGAVLLLDDLHEADAESLELVRYIANARIDGVTVIGTMRPSESVAADEVLRSLRRDGVVDVIDLATLGEREVGDLIAALLDGRPPEPLVADVVAKSDGVPLLVEEVLLAHVRAGTIDTDASGLIWRGGVAAVPLTIRDLVEARVGTLDPAHRTVLVAGAVIGDFKPSLMTAVAEADDAMVADALPPACAPACSRPPGHHRVPSRDHPRRSARCCRPPPDRHDAPPCRGCAECDGCRGSWPARAQSTSPACRERSRRSIRSAGRGRDTSAQLVRAARG